MKELSLFRINYLTIPSYVFAEYLSIPCFHNSTSHRFSSFLEPGYLSTSPEKDKDKGAGISNNWNKKEEISLERASIVYQQKINWNIKDYNKTNACYNLFTPILISKFWYRLLSLFKPLFYSIFCIVVIFGTWDVFATWQVSNGLL